MTRTTAAWLVLGVAACAAAPPPPARAPVAEAVVVAAVPPSPARAPVAEAEPDAWSSACVDGADCVVGWQIGGRRVRAVVPASRDRVDVRADGIKDEDSVMLEAGIRVARLALYDLRGDGRVELVAFLDASARFPDGPTRSTYVVDVDLGPAGAGAAVAPRVRATELRWTEAAIGVVRPSADLGGAAARVRSFAPFDATTPTDTIVVRFVFAKPDDLRSIVAARGLDVCEERSGHATPHGKHCTHYAVDKVPDDAFEWLEAPFAGGPTDEPERPLQGCGQASSSSGRSEEICHADTGGPAILELHFTGAGADRRLTEITFDEYENT